MEIIILGVIAVLVIRFIKNRVDEKNASKPYVAPAEGTRAYQKAEKNFQSTLRTASGTYGEHGISAMNEVAAAYAQGDGVRKDAEKAKAWKERAIRAMLQQKTTGFNRYTGASGYSAEDHLSFFTDGKLVPPDLEKAEELVWLFHVNGTRTAPALMRQVMDKKYPGKFTDEALQNMLSDYPVYLYARTKRSRDKYEWMKNLLTQHGMYGDAGLVDNALGMAQWQAQVISCAFPGATPGLEAQFQAARAIEAAGQDFVQAAKAYEAPAQGGHSEAMRRLGVILRDVISEHEGSAEHQRGMEWLQKASMAGNALADFDLGRKQLNVSFIAGLAAQRYPEALYALGCLLERGWGGPANWDAAQIVFRHLEQMIGTPASCRSGEGIEWLRKLGEKFSIIDDGYYNQLTDAGCALGYGPSQTELLYSCELVMKRAWEQSQNKCGDYGDFGYCRYIISHAQQPIRAGIARAKAIAEACREDQSGYTAWKDEQLRDAEAGKGIWAYSASNGQSPADRVAAATKMVFNAVLAVYYTRRSKGLNYFEQSASVRESGEGLKAENAVRQAFGSAAAAQPASAPRREDEGSFGPLDWPVSITDMYGNRYVRQAVGLSSAEFYNDQGHGLVTIRSSQVKTGLLGHSANVDGVEYSWDF